MKQRLALILALIHEPDIVLLDESDLGMDIVNLNYLMETLKNLAAKRIRCPCVSVGQAAASAF